LPKKNEWNDNLFVLIIFVSYLSSKNQRYYYFHL
jgi:hypothetical protein